MQLSSTNDLHPQFPRGHNLGSPGPQKNDQLLRSEEMEAVANEIKDLKR